MILGKCPEVFSAEHTKTTLEKPRESSRAPACGASKPFIWPVQRWVQFSPSLYSQHQQCDVKAFCICSLQPWAWAGCVILPIECTKWPHAGSNLEHRDLTYQACSPGTQLLNPTPDIWTSPSKPARGWETAQGLNKEVYRGDRERLVPSQATNWPQTCQLRPEELPK